MNFSKKHITIAIIVLFVVYINFFRNKENMTNYTCNNRRDCKSSCRNEGFPFGSYINNTCTCAKFDYITQNGNEYSYTHDGVTYTNPDVQVVAHQACNAMGATNNRRIKSTAKGFRFKCEKVLSSC